ncbi:MAG: ASKHA domain-containing protein, partial [Pseudomonadota bacterium]
HLLDIWPGLHEGGLFGLAIDLGSTTIAAHLCDLVTGEVRTSSGIMNPQIRFGEDLMSRVSYAMMNPGGDKEMTNAVREAIDTLAADIAKEAGIDPSLIIEAVFVCNPVMHHLLLGLDPVELGQAPFALATSEAVSLDARDLDLSAINPSARLFLLPCIAGHVGADAAAVALSEQPGQSEDLVLVVDVGTNAEILLGDKTRVLACSSPTGPAFEGAQISSGQRAAAGAIERIEIDPDTKEPRFRVIGCNLWSDEDGFARATAQTGITGICGSGIIEAVAEMRIAGLLDASGLIGSAAQTGTLRSVAEGRTNAYLIHDGTADGGPRITVTQGDIRAIQLAKSALYAGARLLMDERGVDHVDRIVLAGAFGAHISTKHAMVLGMIPDAPLDKVTSAGNAAGTGARIALCNIAARSEIETMVRDITKVETAIEPKFQEHFVNASAIPNSADPFPILNSVVTLPDVSFNTGGGEAGGRRRRRRG